MADGEILIDDMPIQDYKLCDLRLATAIMFQDYHHFGLSVRSTSGTASGLGLTAVNYSSRRISDLATRVGSTTLRPFGKPQSSVVPTPSSVNLQMVTTLSLTVEAMTAFPLVLFPMVAHSTR